MIGWGTGSARMRHEALFGDRVVACRADRPQNFQAMLADAATRNPGGEALVCGNYRSSWRMLKTTVDRVAAGLAAHGVEKGDRVALLIGNRPEFVIALYAITTLGAIAVPISVREQAPGIAYALDHSASRVLMFDPVFEGQLPELLSLKNKLILIAISDGHEPWAELQFAQAPPAVDVAESDIAAILYTSGTTGKPKGAMIAHVNLVHAALVYEQVMQLGDGERSIVAVPMTHVTGLTALIAAMARCAGALIIMPEFRAEAFVELAATEAMTHSVLVPAMYNLILARADLAGHDLSRWRIGGFGGAPMPAPTIEGLAWALPSLGLMNLYGATETSCAMLIMPIDQAAERREQVGRAAPGVDIVIMNEFGIESSVGETGEIWLRGASVIPGYWKDEAATRAALIAGFWRSGDIGSIDEAGYFSVLDRIKDMIIRGGFKIYSAEVESVLAEHPGVLESAVVGRPCPVLGERVHAFVAARDEPVGASDLARFCAERLADYKRPETYTIQQQPLPRNANGKLLKREMRAKLLADC